jgi:uncharacterized protein (TIGR02391 family)
MTKDQSIAILKRLIDEIPYLKTLKYKSVEVARWKRVTQNAIKRIFQNETDYLREFVSIKFASSEKGNTLLHVLEIHHQRAFEAGLDQARVLLESMIDEIQNYWQSESYNLWSLLHPQITKVSQSLFENAHYADSVLASLREVNTVLKSKVKSITNEELDGVALMNKTFSPDNPILKLGDISTQTGKDLQKGYMLIFAGAITGIRNPKAHGNLVIDENRAIHLLFLASLLMFKVDEAYQ